jgi:hypothetical protein
MTAIGKADVEIVNSLQVQNAKKCLYFREGAQGALETEVLRVTLTDILTKSFLKARIRLRLPADKGRSS